MSLLRYCHENGCPWDEKTRRAVGFGTEHAYENYPDWGTRKEVRKYLDDNGCPGARQASENGEVSSESSM